MDWVPESSLNLSNANKNKKKTKDIHVLLQINKMFIKQTTLTKISRVVLNNSYHKTVNQSIKRFHDGTHWRSPDTNSLLQT